MAFPLRRYQPDPDESQSVRPMGPVIVEDEPAPATAPAGARVPPRRLPPGVSGTDFEPTPLFPPWRPLVPFGGGPRFVADYISFLPGVVAVVLIVLLMAATGGIWAIHAMTH